MSENIEREIKISLTKEQYNTAEKLFQWSKIIEQKPHERIIFLYF